MNRPDLPAVIRRKLENGSLPQKVPIKLEESRGTGATCDGCGQPIKFSDVQHALFFVDRVFRLHFACAGEWAAQRRKRELGPGS